jgi:amicyanin
VTSTLQGASRGGDQVLYGFEFTIPLTLSRWFGHKPKPAAPAAAAVTGPVFSTVIKGMSFVQPQIEIAVGTTVTWKNEDQLAHTVTATDQRIFSGMIESGSSWSHTFNQAGTFTYACTPHPFMKGTVVVK